MIYNLSHIHSKGNFGTEKTMDKNPDRIVSKKIKYTNPFQLLSVKHGDFSFRVEDTDLWGVNSLASKKANLSYNFHGDPDYQSHPAGTVLALTQE